MKTCSRVPKRLFAFCEDPVQHISHGITRLLNNCMNNQQVVLAVDDSRSMAENGCGGFALEAVTLLARALARLEVGQLGVLRFGGTDHVRLLHALDAPFTDANGPDVLSALRFDQVPHPSHFPPSFTVFTFVGTFCALSICCLLFWCECLLAV